MKAAFKIIIEYLSIPVLITLNLISLVLLVVSYATSDILMLAITGFLYVVGVELLFKIIMKKWRNK